MALAIPKKFFFRFQSIIIFKLSESDESKKNYHIKNFEKSPAMLEVIKCGKMHKNKIIAIHRKFAPKKRKNKHRGKKEANYN